MSEPKDWSDFEKGDFLHIVEDYGDQLYEVTAVGTEADKWYLKAVCFFGMDKDKKITLWKV